MLGTLIIKSPPHVSPPVGPSLGMSGVVVASPAESKPPATHWSITACPPHIIALANRTLAQIVGHNHIGQRVRKDCSNS